MHVFLNRINLAACDAGSIYFVLYLPYVLLINFRDRTLKCHKIIPAKICNCGKKLIDTDDDNIYQAGIGVDIQNLSK
ncbi:unnamed protein product [Rotaria sp. Silwood2]|nr:unnamed protein product [Rotaria sp. Silwood2]